MKKYISLEHAIRKAVAEQNYKKKALDESISPVDYDKPKEVPQAFFKPVHIQPRKGEDQIPAGGPVRSRRNYEKEKSSETMHPNLKNEETVDEATLLALLPAGIATGAIATKEIAKRTAPKLADDVLQAMARTIKGEKKPTEPAKPEQKPGSPTAPAPERPFDVPPNNLPAVVPPKPTQTPPAPATPAPVKVEPLPKQPAPAPTKTEPLPVEVRPAPAPTRTPSTRTQTRTETLPQTRTETKPSTPTLGTTPTRLGRRIPAFDIGGSGSPQPTEPFYVSGRIPLPKRIIHAKLRKEETRYDIKNVSRPEDSREEEIVGRPKSKYKLSKQAEIIRKIIEDKKIILKKEKEENLGKNPMVNTEPELKHNQLDQGS
jgi:hypothetical protein